jgi:hypothetical protein
VALDFLPGFPEVPEPQELGFLLVLRAAKARVGLVGGGLALGRALAHVLVDSGAAITSTSARLPRSRAARIMRPIFGSRGSLASSRPMGVRFITASPSTSSTAPSSASSW